MDLRDNVIRITLPLYRTQYIIGYTRIYTLCAIELSGITRCSKGYFPLYVTAKRKSRSGSFCPSQHNTLPNGNIPADQTIIRYRRYIRLLSHYCRLSHIIAAVKSSCRIRATNLIWAQHPSLLPHHLATTQAHARHRVYASPLFIGMENHPRTKIRSLDNYFGSCYRQSKSAFGWMMNVILCHKSEDFAF